jgi:hypothetical protein
MFTIGGVKDDMKEYSDQFSNSDHFSFSYLTFFISVVIQERFHLDEIFSGEYVFS